jgi:hypothetical protein
MVPSGFSPTSANGAPPYQPGATPQELHVAKFRGLKARTMDRTFALDFKETRGTWGVAPGCYGMDRWSKAIHPALITGSASRMSYQRPLASRL